MKRKEYAAVAQLDRVPDSDSGGRGFESRRPYQKTVAPTGAAAFLAREKGFEPSGSEWRAGGTPEPRGGPPAGGGSRRPYQKTVAPTGAAAFLAWEKGFEPSGSEWRADGTPEPRGGPPAGGGSRRPYQKTVAPTGAAVSCAAAGFAAFFVPRLACFWALRYNKIN